MEYLNKFCILYETIMCIYRRSRNRINCLLFRHLDININVLILDSIRHKSFYYYESVIPTDEIINILYKNRNHYQLLFKRKNENEEEEKESLEEEEEEEIENYKNRN